MTGEERRTVIHVARAWVEDGVLKASRDVAALQAHPRPENEKPRRP